MVRSSIGAALAVALLTAPYAAAQGVAERDPLVVAATTICTPTNVGVFDTRIHVRCSVGVSGIWYFAVSTSDPPRVARALALFTTAQASGRDLRIYYDPANTSGAAIGCAASDCRLADGIELL